MVEVQAAHACPSCGTELSRERWSAGLCPACLIELALEDTSLEAELRVDLEEAPTLQFTEGGFAEGEIHGERYRIRSLLGRGGMGEVWRAYDLKLRLDVALKALRTELIADEQALETLRQEVRVAREVISPNVCRVYDLEELDGQELISMEYVDGTTLQEILKDRSPLGLNEAREIASQFLAGLEAIHAAGLIHRDIKPENVMVTRTGRVVVMDFGIAKGLGDARGGMVAGTPAYMSPEQAQGGELDARSDVFSAGVVLAEMVAPGGIGSFEDRRRVWEGIHQETPELLETPWTKVIAQAVAADLEERFAGAAALARALEEVTLRAAGDEEVRPYPGLSAFQQEDARFFFGRELEVEALWKKLRRPHLLAVIGPSGAGKSSFLRAGLLPTLTDGWQAIVTTPGNRPFHQLARALAPGLGDALGVAELLPRADEPDIAVELVSEWRRRDKHGLVIVDQFEELFTQCATEVQENFAELLGRLPLEADVHVLLSMRDDFLLYCSDLDSLAPVFSELSPLKSLSGAALRRALVEPALRCGYRFEEEGIVEEMLAEVEGERGALPMVAFTAARLWEERDRERGYLTREAYEAIGGVGGALAQHAEATLEQIGQDRIPIVRELFRNLVTAQGTRAARDRDELLSVFSVSGARYPATAQRPTGSRGLAAGRPSVPTDHAPEEATEPEGPALAAAGRQVAAHVLDTLIDARLLTSYEVPGAKDEDRAHHHIEVVHESLLTHWPRLVRWQMQDAEGAKLRDELRHQAHVWEAKGRPDDLLWTGTSYKEYELWRERYPGGLSTQEEAFAAAMAATASQRRRRRRLAVAALVTLALGIAAVTTSLWRRSEMAERQARDEARRAEASKLLALAQLKREEDPTEALAHTAASLELADTREARYFALRLLWEAPPALELQPGRPNYFKAAFSPDGSRLAIAGISEEVRVWTEKGGNRPVVLPGHPADARGGIRASWASNELLVTGANQLASEASIWRFPAGERVRTIDFGGRTFWQVGQDMLLAETFEDIPDQIVARQRSWQLPHGEPRALGRDDWSALGASMSWFVENGRGWLYAKGDGVYLRPLPAVDGRHDRLLGRHASEIDWLWPLQGELPPIYSLDRSGEVRVWDFSQEEPRLAMVIPPPVPTPGSPSAERYPDPSLRWAAGFDGTGTRLRVWDLKSWPEARPLTLRRSGSWFSAYHEFHPQGEWLVALRAGDRLTFWPLQEDRPRIVDGYSIPIRPVTFSPDGLWLVTNWPPIDNRGYTDTLRLWPLPGNPSLEVRTLTLPEVGGWDPLLFDPQGRYLFVSGTKDRAFVVPLDGSPPRRLERFSEEGSTSGAVSPSGRRVATAFLHGPEPKTLRVWDLHTGDLRLFDLPEGSSSETAFARGIWELAFVDEETLYTAGDGGVRRWDLESGEHELVLASEPGHHAGMKLGPDGRTALVFEGPLDQALEEGWGSMMVLDLVTGETRAVSAFSEPGLIPFAVALDASGTVVVSGDREGVVRVGRLSGGEPHLLVGHEGPVDRVAICPDLRWVASTGQDDTLRLWPMPDLEQVPLHTLPLEELIAKLESMTNLRVVRDPDSAEGWKVELDPFPGWAEVPTW